MAWVFRRPWMRWTYPKRRAVKFAPFLLPNPRYTLASTQVRIRTLGLKVPNPSRTT